VFIGRDRARRVERRVVFVFFERVLLRPRGTTSAGARAPPTGTKRYCCYYGLRRQLIKTRNVQRV